MQFRPEVKTSPRIAEPEPPLPGKGWRHGYVHVYVAGICGGESCGHQLVVECRKFKQRKQVIGGGGVYTLPASVGSPGL
jgi:hypothetical protein